ncbi:MAG: LysR family transcriptional regulator [Enterocloster sp.]
MDIEAIQTFIVLAGCRNFTKTAELMHVVQSTVSNRIRMLEEYAGAQLVTRDKSGVQLTEEGRVFLEYAGQISSLSQNALQEINMVKRFEDRLNIGCIRWVFDLWMNQQLTQYSVAFPQIALNVHIGHSGEMVPMLQNKLLDMAVISYEMNNSSIESIPFKKSEIILVGERTRFNYLREGVTTGEILMLPLIYSELWEEDYLMDIRHNLPMGKGFRVHTNMLDSARSFCLAGAGCCLLPRIMVEKELEEGKLVQIPVLDCESKYVQTFLVYNKNRIKSKSLQSWFQIFKRPAELFSG